VDGERPRAAVEPVVAARGAFQRPMGLQHLVPRPPRQAVVGPRGEVRRQGTQSDGRVDRRRAAQNLAPGRADLAVERSRGAGCRVESPRVVLVAADPVRGEHDVRVLVALVRRTGFQEKHAARGILGQPGREYRSRRAAADDHVVEPVTVHGPTLHLDHQRARRFQARPCSFDVASRCAGLGWTSRSDELHVSDGSVLRQGRNPSLVWDVTVLERVDHADELGVDGAGGLVARFASGRAVAARCVADGPAPAAASAKGGVGREAVRPSAGCRRYI
jgi:hypothetical protein